MDVKNSSIKSIYSNNDVSESKSESESEIDARISDLQDQIFNKITEFRGQFTPEELAALHAEAKKQRELASSALKIGIVNPDLPKVV